MSLKKEVITKHHNKAVAKGALVNFLGTIGKLMMPVFFIIVSRLYGATILGLFVLVHVLMEMMLKLIISGLNDGVLMFVSRYIVDKKKHDLLYNTLVNGFVIGGLISVVLILFAFFDGLTLFPVYNNPELQKIIRIMISGFPFYVFPVIAIAGIKGFIEMKWDALVNGFVRPFSLAFFAFVFYQLDFGIIGLAWGFFLTGVVMTIVSVFAFWRYYSIRRLMKSLKKFSLQWELIRFAFPQNLNMTFNNFITNLDVMMLGYFKLHPALIGYYSIGAQIVRNLRQVKLAFSGAFSPVIAQLKSRSDASGLNLLFNKVIRWAMLLVFPLSLILFSFHREILQLFNSDFGSPSNVFSQLLFSGQLLNNLGVMLPDFESTKFMLILVGVPFLSCSFGLAGNVLVMTGHSGWNLLNSIMIALMNFIFNLLFIPRWGLVGAAVATLLSSFSISILQLVEVRYLNKVKYNYRENFKIVFSFLIALGLFSLLSREIIFTDYILRTLVMFVSLLVYLVFIILFKVRDFKYINFFKKRS